MPFKNITQVTRTTHTRRKNTPPQRLEIIPPGFGLISEVYPKPISARAKGQQAGFRAQRRAVKEDELHAELEQQGQRNEARRRLSHLQQLADQRRAQLQQHVADLAVHLAQRQLKNLHRRSASAANTKARRMKLQDNVRAVVVKEVQLRDPVLTGACTAAPAPAPAPVALPSTAHCPASGDHPPTSTRPPPTRTAIRAARRSSANGLWGQGQGWWHVSCGEGPSTPTGGGTS